MGWDIRDTEVLWDLQRKVGIIEERSGRAITTLEAIERHERRAADALERIADRLEGGDDPGRLDRLKRL